MSETAERLARIETHVSAILADQSKLHAYLTRVLEKQEARLREVEISHAQILPRLETVGDEIGTLRKRAYIWDGFNTVAAFVAGLVGINQRG